MSSFTLASDLKLDASKFDPKAIDKATKKNNDALIKVQQSIPKWWEVGAEKFRQMRWNGETPLPKPVVLESGKNIKLPSRESGREIPCRVFQPKDGKPKGVFYHIHGGGWVLQSEHHQDIMLDYLANHTQLAVLSVGYRLAPEHPYPAGNEDCFDVADYLVDNAEKDYGAPLLFMGGDSAGGHLSALTCYHLLNSRPKFAFKGLVLNFGAYDLSGFLPQAWTFDLPLVLDVQIMENYREAYLPGKTQDQRRDMWISPFFADLTKMKLPSALFTCGTLDCLLDDSVLMAAKWQMSGAEGILKVYPGAPHGFVFFPPGDNSPETQKALDDITTYVNERM
ncbi:hypothetical protein BAUCODRAFT_147239 [Baudoinia panamericana UAMH 10762]|uniref:Alpha/beta hydrolase fold-3 domain-containing protein n=1 Tax=Baudoinia panamericana (strain UAMH 10762) TaxID=717646 RepID=M2NCZ7_BAUPA|nr:uncharacterized protein BAUCODRAFT_147239 [Baudoinia panamericana UAMH 10762]EMC97069.1 hypothetical protein BAUCODRAFT_147239 [Baudoinia panamericana UAMH 10762]